MDSSARGLLFKQDVSRVRQLDTKFLWLPDYTRRKLLELAVVNTLHNASDLGTTLLSNKRTAYLMHNPKLPRHLLYRVLEPLGPHIAGTWEIRVRWVSFSSAMLFRQSTQRLHVPI